MPPPTPPEMPKGQPARAVLALLLAAIVLAVAGWWLRGAQGPGEVAVSVLDPAQVRVVRTPGGLFEVATLRKAEEFGWQVSHTCPLIDCRELFGKTTSAIRVMAHYTYRIPLAPEWTLRLRDGHYELTVPPPRPSLPVAFDTSRMEIRTARQSWFSPAAGPNREAVVRHLGTELARRAGRPEYLAMVQPAAAATVAEFAAKWMREQGEPLRHPVRVRFQPDPQAP